MIDSPRKMLLNNRAWAQERLAVRPDFFQNLAVEQRPEFLWIGCSDSRVPAEEITGAGPGELFVHRNVANLVVHTDFNLLSVLQYSVEVLKVKYIIVCGHYGCGGVANAMTHKNLGLINKWLRHVKDSYRLHRSELEALTDPQDRFDRLVEINVREQVRNLADTSIVQTAWANRQAPEVLGWVYDMRNGLIKEVASVNHNSEIEDIYRFDINLDPPE